MSGILCRCNYAIKFIDCPSKVWHCAYPKSVVSAFLKTDPQYLLSKLYYDYDWDYHFWRCERCGRMYMFPNYGRRPRKIYSISRKLPTIPWDEIQKLPEYYLFSDFQLAEPLEFNEELALSEFLAEPPHPYRFFVSEDESIVHVYNSVTQQIEFVYKEEKIDLDEDDAKRASNKS